MKTGSGITDTKKSASPFKPGSIEEQLEEHEAIRIFPQGYSMYPMLIPGRDQAVLTKAIPEELRRGDVVLYRREDGMLVLHRLCRIRPEGFYMVGDNQTEVEGPLKREQIKGKLTAFTHRGREIHVTNPLYRLAAGFWLLLRPIRNPIKKPLALIKAWITGHK